MKYQKFTEWSTSWKKLREFNETNSIDKVLEMWKNLPPIKGLRVTWEMLEGFRKKTNEAGEKKIERLLLGDNGKKSFFIHKENQCVEIINVYHNFATTRVKKGQVIADCLGIIEIKKVKHPIAIEVKVKANGPWYAAVENLQQVRLLRSNIKNIKKLFSNISVKGAWGMVVAPKKYYEKKEYKKACELLEKINNKRTEARIMFASYSLETLKCGNLNFEYGYWPRK